MMEIIEMETHRLRMRQWKKADRPIFAQLNADPLVMKYFPRMLNEWESNRMADKIQCLIAERGWGFWAVEEKERGEFIGFVGLHEPLPELPFTPCVEIGWRLAKQYWGKGYATEAANAALEVGFKRLNLAQILAFTSVCNRKSRAVMERLNMLNSQQNFEHPGVPIGSPLREHVLYKLSKARWEAVKNAARS